MVKGSSITVTIQFLLLLFFTSTFFAFPTQAQQDSNSQEERQDKPPSYLKMVANASDFPISPGTNPQATLMMLGRYFGLKMIRERERSTDDL
ncbi:(R)-mandelonitrile lyase [Trifolium repens]|nr:(R)-mandelonitrile lyase [Trifolium repens]